MRTAVISIWVVALMLLGVTVLRRAAQDARTVQVTSLVESRAITNERTGQFIYQCREQTGNQSRWVDC